MTGLQACENKWLNKIENNLNFNNRNSPLQFKQIEEHFIIDLTFRHPHPLTLSFLQAHKFNANMDPGDSGKKLFAGSSGLPIQPQSRGDRTIPFHMLIWS